MLSDKLEIILKEAYNEQVSLDSLTPEALESFMTVMSSLKYIASSIASNDLLTFSIKKGSAVCAVEASTATMDLIYEEIDTAIKGESEDKELTSHLRSIQEQVKRSNFDYYFLYKPYKKEIFNIHQRLKDSSKIIVKRKKRPYTFKIKIVKGFLNQIGGKFPNYHFDYGHGEKITIGCTQEEAMIVNQFLYQEVDALLLCKEWTTPDKRDEYSHKQILDPDTSRLLKTYLKTYYREENLLEKLTLTHDFIDETFETTQLGHKVLSLLLIAFNDKNFHLSELKTLLVISKPFKNHESIKNPRKALLETYTKKKLNG